MSTSVAGRLAATTGIATMIIAAGLSIMKMYEVIPRTPFTTADLVPALAVIIAPLVVLAGALVAWLRGTRAGWLMITATVIGFLAIMNVGISSTADGVTSSSHDVTAQVLAGAGAVLIVAGVVIGRRSRTVHGSRGRTHLVAGRA